MILKPVDATKYDEHKKLDNLSVNLRMRTNRSFWNMFYVRFNSKEFVFTQELKKYSLLKPFVFWNQRIQGWVMIFFTKKAWCLR